MRIISDFHDYYDSVQAAGQDQSLIYFRKSENIEVGKFPFPVFRSSCYADLVGLKIQQHMIGFCGKIYPTMVVTCLATNKSAICFDLAELDHFIETNWRKSVVDEYRAKPNRLWQWFLWPGDLRRNDFKKYFAECATKKDAFANIFLEKHCPVWIGTVQDVWRLNCMGKITYNGCLKNLEFFRLFDTFSAFQEISMFLGGLAVPQKEIPEVPDKIMVGVKGFDKWSFRKPPRDK